MPSCSPALLPALLALLLCLHAAPLSTPSTTPDPRSPREFGVPECGRCTSDSDCMSHAYLCTDGKCVRRFGHSFISIAKCFPARAASASGATGGMAARDACAPCRARVEKVDGWRVFRSTCKQPAANCVRGHCVTPDTMHLCFPALRAVVADLENESSLARLDIK